MADAVWLDILPSLDKFGPQLTTGTAKASSDAGKKSGGAWSAAFGGAAADGGSAAATKTIIENAKKAESAVETATSNIGKARAAQKDANARVITAEDSLAKAVEKYGDSSAQAAAASERLESARIKQKMATDKLEAAESSVRAAHNEAKEATNQLATAAKNAGKSVDEFKSSSDAAAESIDDAADSSDGFNISLGKLAAGIGAAIGGAALLGSAFADALDFEDGTAKLTASLDLTAAESERMGAIAGDLYAQAYGESIDDVTVAMDSVISSIKGIESASDEHLTKVTRDALNLAKTFDVDVTEAANTAGTMITNGLAADGEEAMDLLTTAMQKMPAHVRGEALPALTEYGKHFDQLGIDGPQAIGMLISASEQGVIGVDKMGDALKEFTIRASSIDDTAAQDALTGLGINAKNAANDLLAGGDTASIAMGNIITALEGVKDPGEQASAAIALFGTPLEDLGLDQIPAFLSAINPATQGVTDFAGAADEMAETLGGTTSSKLETLKRSFMDMLSDGITPLLDPAQQVIDWLTGLRPELESVASWIGENEAVLGTFVATVGGAAAAFFAWNGAIAAWNLITKIATGVQAAFNLVMAANPIMLVVVAVAALAAGLTYFFTQTETGKKAWSAFTGFMSTAWEAVKIGLKASWDWIKEWIFDPLAAAATWVWEAAQTAWDTVGKPVWDGIKTAFDVWWTAVKVVFVTAATVVDLLWQGMKLAWDNVGKPVWEAVKTGLKTVWDWIKTNVVDRMIEGFQWYWDKVVAVKNGALAAWDLLKAGLKVGWDWIKTNVVDRAVSGFQWIWDKVIAMKNGALAAWDLLKSGLKTTWDWIKNNVLDKFAPAVEKIGTTFENVRAVIKAAWDKIKGITAKPVNFVINTVYTKGIKSTWDKIAEKVGLSLRLPKIEPVAEYARGGVVLPGYTPGRDVHEFYSPTAGRLKLSGGESIMRPEFTRMMGGPAGIERLNKAARTGALPTAAFAGGGVWDKVKSGAKGAWNWTKDGAKAGWDWTKNTAESVANFIGDPIAAIADLIGRPVQEMLGRVAPGMVGDVLKQIPGKVLDSLGSWAQRNTAARELEGGPGGPSAGALGMGYQAMVKILKARFPDIAITSTYRPGAITATGHKSLHGMGRAVDMSPRMDVFNWLRAMYPNSTELIFSPANGRQLSRGRNWLYKEPTRGDHWDHVHWGMKDGGVIPTLYDNGGVLPPGNTLVSNQTGRPELVLNEEQVRSLGRAEHGTLDLSDSTIERLARTIAAYLGLVGDTVREVQDVLMRARTLERMG